MTVNEVMKQRLTRGTPVVIAESYRSPDLRGKNMVVASKTTVPCKGDERCAGDWCDGNAVFLTTPESFQQDKRLAWRKNTVKICLTHLKDKNGVLLAPPPLLSQNAHADQPLTKLANEVAQAGEQRSEEDEDVSVSWNELARAHQAGDINKLAFLARALKRENEKLVRRTLAVQEKLIERLS